METRVREILRHALPYKGQIFGGFEDELIFCPQGYPALGNAQSYQLEAYPFTSGEALKSNELLKMDTETLIYSIYALFFGGCLLAVLLWKL